MTYWLTPVGSLETADAFIGFVDTLVEIPHDDVIADVARSVASVALADVIEFLLDFARGSSLCTA